MRVAFVGPSYVHFDLPNPILRFRPPNKGIDRSAPQTPSKNAIKYICKKWTFFWRHQDVLHPMAEYSSTPKGVLEYPWSTTRGTHSAETHGRQRDLEILHSAIRAPRSGRILMRRDPIFQLANTVVNEVRKRAFSARRMIWSAGGGDAASTKNGEVCALRY